MFRFSLLLIVLIVLWGMNNGLVIAQANAEVELNGNEDGREFQGIGAVSAGASSRLLYDYPESERSQILDYLFKPDYGANLQILKVEIGGDMNSTDGSEASHMRNPGEVNCNRGYEWWLMKEAKKRNPDIKLAALAWGVPGWTGGEFWTQSNIDYHLAWLDCAEQNNLDIDYMGGWNERGYDVDWFISFDEALEEQYPDIQIIGADDCCSEDLWRVVDDINQNQAFNDAVDMVGVHFACGHRGDYGNCESPEKAHALDKPLLMSENSALNHDVGAMPIARALNRMYIDARLTGYMSWAAISAWYANLPIADTGLMLAEWPWSGYYQVGKSPWAYAHTTQFTEPGWHYIDNASGYFSSGASYVTLQSPDSDSYTIVVEAMDAGESQTIDFSVGDDLPADKTVHLWATNLDSDDSSEHFNHVRQIESEDGEFQFTLQPGYLYTLSTATGNKGTDVITTDITEQMPVPFSEDFEEYGEGSLARYFSDINGAFETTPCGGGRGGYCYRQVVTRQPINWNGIGNIPPTTIVGDPRWWGDYKASVDFMMEESGYVELITRIAVQKGVRVAGYHLQVHSSGSWKLYRQDLSTHQQQDEVILASGSVSVGIGEWHQLALDMEGTTIRVIINGEQVEQIKSTYFTSGQIGLRVSAWDNAQFDNVDITRNGDWPDFVPIDNMEITATSDHPDNYRGYDYTASNAIDGRPETAWHSEWQPKAPLPQSVTVDLGGSYNVQGLTYQPRIDNDEGGMITDYNIYVSTDGATFDNVAGGSWQTGTATKIATWKTRSDVRLVKLEAINGIRNAASAGEIQVATKNLGGQTESSPKLPQQFKLEQNYPNPFNSGTTIEYSIPEQSDVTIKLYDVLGRLVMTLVDEKEQPRGFYEVPFDGAELASGMYLYRIEAGDFVNTKKLTLVK